MRRDIMRRLANIEVVSGYPPGVIRRAVKAALAGEWPTDPALGEVIEEWVGTIRAIDNTIESGEDHV